MKARTIRTKWHFDSPQCVFPNYVYLRRHRNPHHQILISESGLLECVVLAAVGARFRRAIYTRCLTGFFDIDCYIVVYNAIKRF